MNHKISTEDKVIFESFQKENRLSNHADSFESIWKLPGKFGKGFVREIALRPGLKLILEDLELQENFVAMAEVWPPPLEFSFCVSGKSRGTVRDIGCEFNMGPKQSSLFSTTTPIGTVEHPAGQHALFVIIWIEPRLLSTLFKGEFDQIPSDLRGIVDGSDKKHYYHLGNLTPSMAVAIHGILNCPYQGIIKRMYLESRAMELITHQLAQLVSKESGAKAHAALRPDDIERIHYARDILIENLQNPPTVYRLSRMVGLNELKLQQGFRQIYGKTVFAYFRDYQFEEARCFLKEGNMNVAEAAYKLGYSKIDNFASSFKKIFGVSPGVYRRSV